MEKRAEYITSRQNSLLVLAEKLCDRKHRRREGLFRFDGRKLFCEALTSRVPLFAVLVCESTAPEIFALAADFAWDPSSRVAVLPDSLFSRVSEEKSPEGVICIAKCLDKIHKIVTIDKRTEVLSALSGERLLLLESVRDPGNLGTIIRSARAFGVDTLMLSADCADIYHQRAIRAAMGTLFTQKILLAEDLIGVVEELAKTRRVFAAALDARAERLGAVSLRATDVAVIGNEGHGISAPLLDACTDRLYIPMEAGVESLNAGIAASVLLWEMYRGESHA